jgi:CRP/FNR family transcriptional regulator, cyclic AMP receptor protein
MARVRSIPRNQIVLYQGEATMQYHIIKEGVVRAYSILENGTEVIVALHGPGDFFPSSTATATAILSVFYYETMTPVELESYPVDQFADVQAQMFAEQPDYWSHRYLGALLHINALAQTTADGKLAHTLQYLTIRFGHELTGGVMTRIELKLTQQDIAALSGISRETVNIELNKLKAKGVVSEKSKLYTVNTKALLKHIGDDALPTNAL